MKLKTKIEFFSKHNEISEILNSFSQELDNLESKIKALDSEKYDKDSGMMQFLDKWMVSKDDVLKEIQNFKKRIAQDDEK